MDERLIVTPQPIRPAAAASPGPAARGARRCGEDFARLLEDRIQAAGVRFSRHAVSRMESRGIHFDAEQLARLEKAVDSAGAKGARDSLVLLGETALVVSVRNHTVVTVVDGAHLKENVFTNIDSAVIA